MNRDQPDITDLGHDVFQIDTRMAGYPGITAGYLIRGSRPCLVETGTSTSAPIVARALAALGVGADDLASVVVTHIHLDHAGGVGDIAAAYPKAEIVVHQRGARHLADPSALMVGAEMAFGDALDQLFGRLAAVPGDRIRALDDTGVVDLGDGRRLDSYHSPGHASHHVGLIDSGSGDLYVGDAVGVYLPDTGDLRPATPSPDFDLDAALASLTRFRALQPTRLLFSHYGPVSNVPEILDRSAEELTVWVEGTRHARRLGLDLDHAVAMVREQTLARYNAYADGADPAVAEKIEVISRAEVSVGGIWHWLGKMAAVPERADLAGLAEFPPSRWLMSPGARCGRPASSPLLAFVQGEDFVHGDASWDGEDRVGNLMGIPLTPDGKTCIGVVFGGPSAEHQISGASALAVIRGLNADRFRPVAIGVDQDCRWRLLAAQTVQEAVARRADGPAIQDRLTAEGTEVELRRGGRLVASEAPGTVIERLDVVFPVMHGPFGEDGVLQGYLEALGVPYVGSGVVASGVGMDKVAMRRAFAAEGIPIAPGVWFTQRQWAIREDPLTLADGLGWPRFVKPANMGSSIGVSRVTGPAELIRAVEEAFQYDDVVLVEEGITGRELLCGVIGDADDAETSLPSELRVIGGFPDYEQKYLSKATTVTSPADVPADVTARVRELSLRAFRAIGGYGLARVDFLYDEAAGRLCAGEINTMPGFTARSMFARGWAETGVPYEQILDRLVDLAFTRDTRRRDRARRPESVGQAVR